MQPIVPDQDQLLDDSSTKAKQQAFYMKKALDSGNLREALKSSSNMLAELRTSLLSPRNYYNLYMQIFDELKYMESQFVEEQKRGRKMADLYESVQHAGNIIPRLYLIITVASVYIQTHEAPAKEILKDVIEMVKGVQHPMRGLFLRYYLLKTLKDKLPDQGTSYEGEGGDISDAIDFILKNLSEMNRLWVRMQHTGVKDKAKREAERNDLRVTVGENVIRLSNLEGVSLEVYKTKVLPQILEIIQNCKDSISQQYLMDCVIQAFPDDFHLNTLQILLEATTNLQTSVDVKVIFINLMDRLSQYASTAENEIEEVNKETNIFNLFKKYIDKIIEEHADTLEIKKLLELEVAFLRFAIKSYPMNTEYINAILESSLKIIEGHGTSNVNKLTSFDNESLKHIVKLLSIPLDTLSLAILNMNQYPVLMKHLQTSMRRTVAKRIVSAVLKSKKKLNELDMVKKLIDFILPLVSAEEEKDEEEPYEFEETQVSVAKLVHLVSCKKLSLYYSIVVFLKSTFFKGGQKRMKYSIPSLVYACLRLAKLYNRGEVEGEQEKDDEFFSNLFTLVLEMIGTISGYFPECALRLHLQATLCINSLNLTPESQTALEEIGYEFASQALVVYQDELSDSESKMAAIKLIVATLQTITFFSADNYDTLVTNSVQYCARLLKKPDQCRAIASCTHLFYSEAEKNPGRVAECLKKSAKLCNICKATPKNLDLLVIMLNKYLYFYSYDKDIVNEGEINGLIQEIKTKIDEHKNTTDLSLMISYFEQTKKAILDKRQSGELADRFKDLEI